MNNFTKEELEGILEALQIIDSDPSIRPKMYWEDNLKDKIQSMIDNYCEHEYENNFGIDSRSRLEKSKNPMCKKCGRYY